MESWLIWLLSDSSRFLNWKGPGKFTESYCTCLYLSTDQVCWFYDLWFKRYIQECTLSPSTNAHCDVIDLVNHGMVKNTKAWISWERNIIFLQNKKTLILCFRWHILGSYRFAPDEVDCDESNTKWNGVLTELPFQLLFEV